MPDGLALGATTGHFAAFRNSSATGCAGTLIAIDDSPALARSETGQPMRLGTTTLKGPGQNARASFRASPLKSPSANAASALCTWVIRGLMEGLPFAA